MTRKAAPPKADARDRLRRVLFLVPYAVRHPGVPVRELARKCGVPEKQILEDLDFLLGVGCPPFAPDDFLDLYVEGDRVHVALHLSFTRPPRFTESEAAALAAAARALGGEGTERVVRALREAVPRDRRAIFEELLACIFAGSPPARDSLLGRIEQAIAARRALRIRYFTATRGEESERVVHPYTLAQRPDHPLPPLPAQRASRRGQRRRFAFRESRRPGEALVKGHVHPVALDVEVEEVVGRERGAAHAEQEVEVLEDLLLRDAALAGQLAHRHAGVADRVGDEEQDPPQPIPRVGLGRGRLAGHETLRASAASTLRALSRKGRGARISARSP